MLNKFLNHRLEKIIIYTNRLLSNRLNFNFGYEMKLLNDKKEYKKALELFDEFKDKMNEKFSSMIITQALKASTQINDFQYGLNIHRMISSRLINDDYILASLIHFYSYIKNNEPNKAIDIFNKIKNPDQVVVIVLFNACAQLQNDKALNVIKKVFQEIPRDFHLNPRILTSLFDALIKCNDCSSAEIIFSKMKKKTTESYGNVMSGFNKENNPEKTYYLFNQMKIDGIERNFVIFLCVIKALSQIGDYSRCQLVIEQIPKSFINNNQIQNALVDMWGKTGYVDQAEKIFKKISQPDHIGYTAMINSYGLNGIGTEAIKIYRHMPIEIIDEVVNICVLNACSHSGLVDDARIVFNNIQNKTEKIYTTMIDCLSRGAFFQEAEQLIDEFERNHLPIWPMHMALLSGARNVSNAYLSQKVYDRIKKLFPESTNPLISAAILLANTYASSGDVDKASDIRIQLYKSSAKRKIGISWTVVNEKYYEFRAHDQSHPRSREIYAELEKMSKELIAHGHQFDSSWITRPINDNETIVSVLCGHSEKLAIAWNFVENPNTSRIQVAKNLRVCGDCHRATKLIAAIRQCEIIVRDANRIHHFYKSGKCSCNDYF
ncbi:unnamed protein product [Rotaria sp. Silwood2]|nr:unnamed protein product [Rotaria sp. Silwood2]CAF3369706.1 unnamed protein product [Rotaria sp. Silwood2]